MGKRLGRISSFSQAQGQEAEGEEDRLQRHHLYDRISRVPHHLRLGILAIPRRSLGPGLSVAAYFYTPWLPVLCTLVVPG